MNLVDLLTAIGKLDNVTWKQKDGDGEFVRVARRTDSGQLVLDYQRPSDGVWIEGDAAWDSEEFLKVFEPAR